MTTEFRPTAEQIPAQTLPYPASQSDMNPQPDSDLSNYKPADKLRGAVVLVGMATGAFYGAVSGGVLGGEGGLEISATQAEFYDNRLAQGHYLLMVKGSDDEIDRAEPVLKAANVQDWMVFNTI
jgi:hypothetical protein